MKGRWAAGIVPRNFAWILKGQLAVSERPGGYAPHHRRVRRQEEILWLGAQGFTRVVSLLPSSHNLHAYEELHLPSSHFPLSAQSDVRSVLAECYPSLLEWLRKGEVVLVHQEELGERVAGVVAGFVCWSGILPEPPQAISAVEQLLKRQMGSSGRAIVGAAAALPGPVGRLSPRHSEPVPTGPARAGKLVPVADPVPAAAPAKRSHRATASAPVAEDPREAKEAGPVPAKARPNKGQPVAKKAAAPLEAPAPRSRTTKDR